MSTYNIVFLDASTIGAVEEINELKKYGDLTSYPFTAHKDVIERIREADIVLTNKNRLDREVIASAPRLKLICVTATGMDNVDLDFARERGIPVKNARAYAAESVAQHTFAVLLRLLHHLPYYESHVKNGTYSHGRIFTEVSKNIPLLNKKRLGIIGLGNIGQAVARIADKGFGMEVAYHSPTGWKAEGPYQQLPLEELLRSSDVLSIHTSLNEHSKYLIDYEKISWMKKSAVLVNMGRGAILVEADLARAIDAELIRGACIDVFEEEPIPLDHPYFSIQNKERLLLTPHIAWAAVEARQNLVKMIVEEVAHFCEGE